MKHFYSKSKFVEFCGCHKKLWLEYFKPEEKKEVNNDAQLINGNLVGDLAMNLFGDYYLAETADNNLTLQAENTKRAIEQNLKVICEAAFLYKNHYCAVDILVNDGDGYSIYEVKSTTHLDERYYYDLAYQYYVLTNSGLKINTTNLVHINCDYVFIKELDLNQYFKINDLTKVVKNKFLEVEELLELSDKILNSNKEIPSIFSSTCSKFGGCPFLDYCKKFNNIPLENSVFNLYNNRSKIKQIESGIITFEDLLLNNSKLSPIQKRQIDFALNDREDCYVDKENINKFLSKLEFPLYFFDFEAFQSVVPQYDNTKPYQQIPFQYSLHILHEDGLLEHKEFLGDGFKNPMADIAEAMINDLNDKGSIIAYNDSFETGRIKELIVSVPQYSKELSLLIDRFVDLADIFQKGYCYNKAMGGSFSIKSVLPALFPDNNELNYKKLEGVHKGDEASMAYINLPNLNQEEYIQTRKNLLAYCKLDTLAMVRIYEKLLELVK